jgi:hypothetical protein
VNVAVDLEVFVSEGHSVAREVNHRLLHELAYLETAVVHVDLAQDSGEEHHRVAVHSHDGLPNHAHQKKRHIPENTAPPEGLDLTRNPGYTAADCPVTR